MSIARAWTVGGLIGWIAAANLAACSSEPPAEDAPASKRDDGGGKPASDAATAAHDATLSLDADVASDAADASIDRVESYDAGDADAEDARDAGDAGSVADAATSDAADAGPATPAVAGYSVLGEISHPFAKPYALAVDSTNHLYVSEQTDAPDTHTLYLASRSFAGNIAPGHSRILKFDATGAYLGWIGGGSDNSKGFHGAASPATAVYGYDPGVFNMIRGMAIDEADHLFVLDNWRIQEFDAAHAFVRWTGFQWPSSYGWHASGQPDSYAGPKIGGFTWGSTLRIHGGRFWVGNWFWNYPGFVNGDWNCISALDVTTGLGVAWLGGALNTATQAKSSGYIPVGAPMEPRSAVAHSSTPGIFSSPRHFVWRNKRLYIVDNTSDPVVSVFDESGVRQPGKLEHLVGAGEKPFAIAVDRFGNVIVSDMYTGSVRFFSWKLDANGEFTQVAEWQLDAPSTPNASYPLISDFAWDSDDNLYVAATTRNKVYKLRLTY